jgi:hypothetical protein
VHEEAAAPLASSSSAYASGFAVPMEPVSAAHRRLVRLSMQLGVVQTAAVTDTVSGVPRFRAGTANGLGVVVEQDAATGEITEEALAHVQSQKLAAVEAEDYALAGQLHQLYNVLHPKNKLTPEQCKPQTAEGQIEFFHKHGTPVTPPRPPHTRA